MTTLNFNDFDTTNKDNFTVLLGTKLFGIKDRPLSLPDFFAGKSGDCLNSFSEIITNKSFLITGISGNYDSETKKINYCFFIEDDKCLGEQLNIEIHELTKYFKISQ